MMNSPYINLISRVAGFNVWSVDGKYIRDRIDIDFTNFGQPLHCEYIPKDELWIDEEHSGNESSFYITHMIAEYKYMSKGYSYYDAVIVADKVEQAARRRSAGIKGLYSIEPDYVKIKKLEDINGLKFYLVDGEKVRKFFYIEFTEGGHDLVYDFIPANEIWIDNDLDVSEYRFVMVHEYEERKFMSRGLSYEEAHKKALDIEWAARQSD